MVLAAGSTFLVQRWEGVGDVPRYLALLALTLALPVLVYVCGVRFQEGRSARVTMIALLGLISIHAGVLGGFVLSQFGDPDHSIARVAQWVAPSRAGAILLVSGAAAVLVPLMWSAYRVLCRRHAALLTCAGALTHGLLWIPDRSPRASTLLLILMLSGASWCAWRVRPQTREGMIAVAFLWFPPILLAARQVLFYDVSWAFCGSVFGLMALSLFALGERLASRLVTRLSTIPALLCVVALWFGLDLDHRLSASAGLLVFGLLAAVPLLAFAWRSPDSRRFFATTAVGVNAWIVLLVLATDPGPLAALEAMALGLGILSVGMMRGTRAVACGGALVAGWGFVVEVGHAITAFQASGWLALAVFGVALVVFTAWLEQRTRRLAPNDDAEPLSKCPEQRRVDATMADSPRVPGSLAPEIID